MNEIYLDNAAATKPLPKIKQIINDLMDSNYANPSALHEMGLNAENIIKRTQKRIAALLNVPYDDIYFTSGGTESNNLAILGIAEGYMRSGRHIITTAAEHASIIEPIKVLETRGFDIDIIPVNNEGTVDIDVLKSKIRHDTILISVIHVNNETGAINDVSKIGAAVKEQNPSVLLHIDAVQSFGKIKIRMNNIDLLSTSSHKIHGLKGCGALYIKNGLKIKPLIYGGGQQKKIRSGTENVIGIAAMESALITDINKNYEHVKNLKKLLLKGLDDFDNVTVNGQNFEQSSPYILNVSFMGVKGEVLLHSLEEKKIYVSTGSACNSKKTSGSRVLEAMGLNKEEREGAIRFSFSILNSEKDIIKCLSALKEIVPALRY